MYALRAKRVKRMYYNNNPIEIIQPNISESPSKEIRNLILGLPIHAIDIKDESTIDRKSVV